VDLLVIVWHIKVFCRGLHRARVCITNARKKIGYYFAGSQKHLLGEVTFPFFLRFLMVFETSSLARPVAFATSPGLTGFPAFSMASNTSRSFSSNFLTSNTLQFNFIYKCYRIDARKSKRDPNNRKDGLNICISIITELYQ
jgi:hypothetical protein